jgi:DNA-binding response OmpR family regulator
MPPREVEIFERLSAIDREAENLRAESAKLRAELRELWEQKQPIQDELVFCQDMRTITWNGGACSLGVKPFKILCVIWNGKNHEATFDDIERIVWKGKIPQSKTVEKIVYRTRKTLEKNNFPYILKNLINSQYQEQSGLTLIQDKKCLSNK